MKVKILELEVEKLQSRVSILEKQDRSVSKTNLFLKNKGIVIDDENLEQQNDESNVIDFESNFIKIINLAPNNYTNLLTVQIKLTLENRRELVVNVLIDSGATQNILNVKLIRQNDIVHQTNAQVSLVDQSTVQVTKTLHNNKIQFVNDRYLSRFYNLPQVLVFPINYDFILGLNFMLSLEGFFEISRENIIISKQLNLIPTNKHPKNFERGKIGWIDDQIEKRNLEKFKSAETLDESDE